MSHQLVGPVLELQVAPQDPQKGSRRRPGAPRSSPRGSQNAPKTIFGSKKRKHEAKDKPRGNRPKGQQRLGVDLEGFGAFWGRPRRSPGRQKADRRKPQRPPNERGRRLEEEGAESRFIQHLSAHIAICDVERTLEVRRGTYESTKSYER